MQGKAGQQPHFRLDQGTGATGDVPRAVEAAMKLGAGRIGSRKEKKQNTVEVIARKRQARRGPNPSGREAGRESEAGHTRHRRPTEKATRSPREASVSMDRLIAGPVQQA